MKNDTRCGPNFLVIGAMKAGTTTLYADLDSHSSIFFPHCKEPADLVDENVLNIPGQRSYLGLYRGARPGQVSGDASTAYAMLPTWKGVPQRARALLGRQVKIIYIVREPVSRIISHHYHALGNERIDPDINRAVRTDSRFIDYSRYWTQIVPWIEVFGEENIKILVFEHYVVARKRTVADVCSFLGVEPITDRVDPRTVHNDSKERRVARGLVQRILVSKIYRKEIQQRIPLLVKDMGKRILLHNNPSRPAPPTIETVRWIIDHINQDNQRIGEFLGLGEAPWQFSEIERRYNRR